jgi:hypothetical protein
LVRRVFKRGEQRLQFGEERSRQSSIDEGRLERRRRRDDGLRFGN